jgi:hypothetical protein
MHNFQQEMKITFKGYAFFVFELHAHRIHSIVF